MKRRKRKHGSGIPRIPGNRLALAYVVRAHVSSVIETCEGNISEAARVLEVHRRTLQRMIERRGADFFRV